MQTQLIRDPVVAVPSLEHLPDGGGTPERTFIETFPFSVGRSESCDFQVDSDRVSREHALLVKEGRRFRIRDLGSTNGTFLNGCRIDESELDNGDILLIADVEFTFFAGGSQKTSNAVTEAIALGPVADAAGPDSTALIRQVRRLHEALAHRCIGNLFEPIRALEGGRVLGYEAVEESDHPGNDWGREQKVLLATECRLTSRIRQLRRMLAAEESLGFPAGTSVFLRVHSSEIGDDWMLESLLDLRNAIRREHRMVIEIPDNAVSDTPYFGQLRKRLAEAGLPVAYHEFTGGASRLSSHGDLAPDFVKLAPSLVPGVEGHGRRQLQAIVKAGQDLGCQVIATAIDSEEDADICRDLGCQFGQGNYLGEPTSIADLLEGDSR